MTVRCYPSSVAAKPPLYFNLEAGETVILDDDDLRPGGDCVIVCEFASPATVLGVVEHHFNGTGDIRCTDIEDHMKEMIAI